MKVGTPVATMGIRGTAVILDISAVDGKVSISVIDQRDGQVHSVQVFNTRGDPDRNGDQQRPDADADADRQFRGDRPGEQQDRRAGRAGIQRVPDAAADLRCRQGRCFRTCRSTPTKAATAESEYADDDLPAALRAELARARCNHPPTVTHPAACRQSTGTPADRRSLAGATPDGGTGLITDGNAGAVTRTPVISHGRRSGHAAALRGRRRRPSPQISGAGGDHFGPVMSADRQYVVYDPDGIDLSLRPRDPHHDHGHAGGRRLHLRRPDHQLRRPLRRLPGHRRHPVLRLHLRQRSFRRRALSANRSACRWRRARGISGDGSTIVVEQGGSSIGIYDSAGPSDRAPITAAAVGTTGTVWLPAISADGQMIAFWRLGCVDPRRRRAISTPTISSTGTVTDDRQHGDRRRHQRRFVQRRRPLRRLSKRRAGRAFGNLPLRSHHRAGHVPHRECRRAPATIR